MPNVIEVVAFAMILPGELFLRSVVIGIAEGV